MLAFHYRPNYNVESYAPPTWADGTDEEISEAVAKADAGEIDLTEYWAVGDERTVHLGDLNNGSCFRDSQSKQDIVVVLMGTGEASGYKDINDKTINFVVGQKDCLWLDGHISSTADKYSWIDTPLKDYLNNEYYNALPSLLKNNLKPFKCISAAAYTSGYSVYTVTSNDYISLFAEKEILGTYTYSTQLEASLLTQIDYYKTTSNRTKSYRTQTSYSYWTRSVDPQYSSPAYFVYILNNGSSNFQNPTVDYGVAPFGCI